MGQKIHTASLKVVLNGLFLISLNLFSLMLITVIMVIARIDAGELVRMSSAFLLNLGIYTLVFYLMNNVQEDIMALVDMRMLSIILISSIALLPAVFLPLNYLLKGEWTRINTLFELWPFQIFVNGLCLLTNRYLLSKK